MPQSSTETGQAVSSASETSETIVTFADEAGGAELEVVGTYDSTMDMAYNGESDIAKYLERPVIIDTLSWAVGQPAFQKLDPWTLWSENAWVAQKLSNYENLRCNLHIKILVNGTQFHYGRMMVGYNPIVGSLDEVTQTRNFLEQDLVGLSQKPHIFLNPTTCEGGTLHLPYFFNDNYFSLTKRDLSFAGDLYYKSMGDLSSASTGTDPVTITTVAWATDIVLTTPTSLNTYTPQGGCPQDPPADEPEDNKSHSNSTIRNSKIYKCIYRSIPVLQLIAILAALFGTAKEGYEPQAGKSKKKSQGKTKKSNPKAMNSGDEYGMGVISQPASAIARAAGELATIPFIAPYARASQMVMGKVGQVAALFGYSRPNIVTDTEKFSPALAGVVSNINASDTSDKLSMDVKQEVCIDSRTTGLDGEDQMTFESLMTRESYITSFTLNESDAVDKILWNSYVTPGQYAVLSEELHLTPMALLSQHFGYWNGSVKFRFQFVKSAFHKGRVLLRWDPRSNSSTVDYNSVYTRIIDISEEDDVEIVIGWGQAQAFLDTVKLTTATVPYSTTRLTTDGSNRYNGVLEMNVVNQLVSPDGASPIRVNVFASACDDMKFGKPVGLNIADLSLFTPQSGYSPQSSELEILEGSSTGDMIMPTAGTTLETISAKTEVSDETMNIFFGESLTSVRELIKRYYFTRSISMPIAAANGISIQTFTSKAQPYQMGWDTTDGLDFDANDSTQCTVGVQGPLQLWTPCFAGWKGGLRHKIVYSAGVEGSMRIQRLDHTNTYGWTSVFEGSGAIDGDRTKFISSRNAKESWDGTHLNHVAYNKIGEVEVPFYTGKRFLPAKQKHAESLTGDCYRVQNTFSANNAPKQAYIEDWVAAGDDYSLFFFTGVPVMYRVYLDENSAANS